MGVASITQLQKLRVSGFIRRQRDGLEGKNRNRLTAPDPQSQAQTHPQPRSRYLLLVLSHLPLALLRRSFVWRDNAVQTGRKGGMALPFAAPEYARMLPELPPPNLAQKTEPTFQPQGELIPKPAPLPNLTGDNTEELDQELGHETPYLLKDALTYPFRDSGWIILLLGTVLAVLAGFAPSYGHVTLVGYMALYYTSIVETTVTGRDRLPDWPDLGSDLLETWHAAAAMVVSQLLCLWLTTYADETDSHWLVRSALWLIGDAYAVVALLRYVMLSRLRAMLPDQVIPAIFHLGKPLLGLLLIRMGLILAWVVLAELWSFIPLLEVVLTGISYFYLWVVQARMLGSFYIWTQHRVQW
jgi:hypothetical protein